MDNLVYYKIVKDDDNSINFSFLREDSMLVLEKTGIAQLINEIPNEEEKRDAYDLMVSSIAYLGNNLLKVPEETCHTGFTLCVIAPRGIFISRKDLILDTISLIVIGITFPALGATSATLAAFLGIGVRIVRFSDIFKELSNEELTIIQAISIVINSKKTTTLKIPGANENEIKEVLKRHSDLKSVELTDKFLNQLKSKKVITSEVGPDNKEYFTIVP